MAAPPSISDSEWIVASAVWDDPGITAAEVVARVAARTPWKAKTIQTFLARLVKKGVLRAERTGRVHHYHPAIPRERCVRAESASFLQRVFGGAVAPLVAHFCETADLTDTELEELRRILRRKTSPTRRPKS